jgi:DNA-binding GntR family transcriptional regulator
LDAVAIARLREINDEMSAAMAELDSLRFGRLNQEFHGLIYEYCPNSALVSMLSDVARRLDAIRRTVFVQIPYRGASSVSEHRELIDLIASGAPAARIEKAAREHKLSTVRIFRALQDQRAPEDGTPARTPRSRS